MSLKHTGTNWTCYLLEDLELDNNQLEQLPSELFGLKSLKHLNVSNNRLEKLPVELWQSPSLFDLNASSNNISTLPLFPLSCCTPRSRKEQRTKPTKEHPLKSPIEEKQNQFYTTKQVESNELNYKLKSIDKANFWTKNSQIVSYNNEFDDLDLELSNDSEEKYSNKYSNKILEKKSTNVECKLIELNLSNNKFRKIPECLSCLAPKLVKLNLSYNQIQSMGAVSDLPLSLKFLDLSNNLIENSIRLLNKSYFKFILVYLNMLQSIKSQTEIKKLENLLLENDFCYFNLVERFLLISKAPTPTITSSRVSMNSNHLPSPPDLSLLRSRQNRDREQSIQASLRSNSTRRRTRSQSRNPNRNSASTLILPNSPGQPLTDNNNKRLLPFDLFILNLKYNRTYSNKTIYDSNEIIEDLLDLEDESELNKKEKQLLNSQNIQIFLEQICPHKRHIKLENLKSLNLSQNKLKKVNFMFDLNMPSLNQNDSESSGFSSLDEEESLKSEDSNKNSILKSPLRKKPPVSPAGQSPVKRIKYFRIKMKKEPT